MSIPNVVNLYEKLILAFVFCALSQNLLTFNERKDIKIGSISRFSNSVNKP